MALANYSDLQASVANWLHRDDLTLQIPDFIALAESEIAKDLRTQEQDVTTTIAVDAVTESLPTRMLEIRAVELQINPVLNLQFRTPLQLAKLDDQTVGRPLFYTITGGNFKFFPTPDRSYDVEVNYIQRYAAFSGDTDTNYVLTNYPGVYLYASLRAAYAFVEDEPAQARAETMYVSEVARAQSAEDRLKYPTGLRQAVANRLP